MMQNNPATPEQLKCIQQLLYQHPNLGQGVRDMAKSIASYDGKSAVRYLNLAIATRHLSPPSTKGKTANHLAIAC